MIVLLFLRRLWGAIGPEGLLIGLLAAALGWQVWTAAGLRHQLARAVAATAAERASHQRTKDLYRMAQETARRMEAQRALRVATEQRRITDEVESDYRARLAAARDLAGRLRAEARTRTDRAPGGQPVPAVPATPGGPDAPTGDGLPDPDEIDWRLKATEQAIQLDALITWVGQQGRVVVNEGQSSSEP